MKSVIACLVAAVMSVAWAARGQSSADETPVVVKIRAKAAGVPRPALKYALTPTVVEQTPGNAAQLYLMANHHILQGRDTEDVLDPWLQKPIGEAMQDRSVPGRVPDSAIRFLEQASRREYCRWETTARQEGFSALLPHLNPMPVAGRMLAVRARAQIAEGKFDEAVGTIRTGVTMARHLNDDAVLVQLLVAAGVFQTVTDRIPELAERAGSPNLYWALAQLPRPFLDVNHVTQFERFATEISFPALKEIDHMTLEEARRVMEGLAALGGSGGNKGPDFKVMMALTLAASYPRAKEYLVAQGMTEERVEAMAVHQALVRYFLGEATEVLDEGAKWFAMPYPQGREGLLRAEALARDSKYALNPLVRMLTPAFNKARLRLAVVDRKIAMLMAVEALRAYAAGHGGRLPGSLEELRGETPVPEDPITGKAFGYRVEGDTAVLEAPAPAGESPRYQWRYEVTVER